MRSFTRGLLVGIGVGLLFAPLPGEELRHLLRERFNEFRNSLPEDSRLNYYARQLANRVEQSKGDLRGYAQQTAVKAREAGFTLSNQALHTGQDVAHKAMQSGQDMASKALHTSQDVASDMAHKAKQTSQDMAHKAKQTGQDLAHKAKQTSQDMASRGKHAAHAGPGESSQRRIIAESDKPRGRAE